MNAVLELRDRQASREVPGRRSGVAAAGVTKEFGAGDAKTAALRGVDLAFVRGPAQPCRRPVRLRQDDADLDHRRPARPDRAARSAVLGTELSQAQRPRARRVPRQEHRLRLSAVQPAAGPDGGGERGGAAAHHRLAAGQGDRQGRGDAGSGRAGAPGRRVAGATVRRPAAAGRHRAGADPRAAAARVRRADGRPGRQARAHGHGTHQAGGRPARAGGHRRHARQPRLRLRRPHRDDERRPRSSGSKRSSKVEMHRSES